MLSDAHHTYTWEPADSDRIVTGELHSFGATEEEALETGTIHFLCLLTMAEIDHPLDHALQVKWGNG